MVHIIQATADDLERAVGIRIETLKAVSKLPPQAQLSAELIHNIRQHLKTQSQTTLLAIDGDVIGCATICYISLMPTFSHPTGKRAHIMNVYVRPSHRRQGIALRMMAALMGEAKQRGVTEISLDATDEGRALYEKCGFTPSVEGMVLDLTGS